MRHHPLNTFLLAIAAGLAMSACDRRDDVPTVVINAPSDPAATTGTATTETADSGTPTMSPETTVQQNPSAAGGLGTPADTTVNGTPPGMTTTLPGATTGTTGTNGVNGVNGTGATDAGGTIQSPGSINEPGTGLNSGRGTGVNGGAGTGLNTGTGTGVNSGGTTGNGTTGSGSGASSGLGGASSGGR